MKIIKLLLASVLLTLGIAHADDGMVIKPSRFGVDETADRFVAAAEKAGLTIFNRIDHAAGAQKVGQSLRPTLLIIFGNPKVGTALMTSDQRAGIDLPLKVLVWQDGEEKVWLGYNSPEYLFDRFDIKDRDKVKNKVTGALEKLSQKATQP